MKNLLASCKQLAGTNLILQLIENMAINRFMGEVERKCYHQKEKSAHVWAFRNVISVRILLRPVSCTRDESGTRPGEFHITVVIAGNLTLGNLGTLVRKNHCDFHA